MAIEVAAEWGLGIYLDTTNNALANGAERQAKRTEVIVLHHSGRWRESPAAPPELADTELELQADRLQTRGADLAHLVHRLLTARRRRSWQGLVWCNRCLGNRPAVGAVARWRDGRLLRLHFGGAPSRCCQEAGMVLLPAELSANMELIVLLMLHRMPRLTERRLRAHHCNRCCGRSAAPQGSSRSGS